MFSIRPYPPCYESERIADENWVHLSQAQFGGASILMCVREEKPMSVPSMNKKSRSQHEGTANCQAANALSVLARTSLVVCHLVKK